MPSRRFLTMFCSSLLAIAINTIFLTSAARADVLTPLHSFQSTNGGTQPTALIMDHAGNFYGVLADGGSSNCQLPGACGAIFKLAKDSNGQWVKTVVHLFTGGSDGARPTGIIMDASGNIFGVAEAGGNSACSQGCGVIFELSPTSSGGMKETVLYTFKHSSDGLAPNGSLVEDASGNLYGVAEGGGLFGVVFKLTPAATGEWPLTVLYSFNTFQNGDNPRGPLVFDAAGNLYGVTASGGSTGAGTVFQLSPQSSGGWSFAVIHNFQLPPSDGIQPMGGLTIDPTGNLFGTTAFGGAYPGFNGSCLEHCGTVFELSLNSGVWTEIVILNFAGLHTGSLPLAGLIFDSAGNLYGTAAVGGSHDRGVAFKLSPNSDGTWTDTVLYDFSNLRDGGTPEGTLVRDASGNLFGTATTAGAPVKNGIALGNGVVFELTPKTR